MRIRVFFRGSRGSGWGKIGKTMAQILRCLFSYFWETIQRFALPFRVVRFLCSPSQPPPPMLFYHKKKGKNSRELLVILGILICWQVTLFWRIYLPGSQEKKRNLQICRILLEFCCFFVFVFGFFFFFGTGRKSMKIIGQMKHSGEEWENFGGDSLAQCSQRKFSKIRANHF